MGIGPTFADLQSAAKTTIDNSPVAGASRVEQDSWDLESQAQPHIPCSYLKWQSNPGSNGDFSVRSAAVSPLAYWTKKKMCRFYHRRDDDFSLLENKVVSTPLHTLIEIGGSIAQCDTDHKLWTRSVTLRSLLVANEVFYY